VKVQNEVEPRAQTQYKPTLERRCKFPFTPTPFSDKSFTRNNLPRCAAGEKKRRRAAAFYLRRKNISKGAEKLLFLQTFPRLCCFTLFSPLLVVGVGKEPMNMPAKCVRTFELWRCFIHGRNLPLWSATTKFCSG
jgi:hypothetical protein